jgi:hypothetical protein
MKCGAVLGGGGIGGLVYEIGEPRRSILKTLFMVSAALLLLDLLLNRMVQVSVGGLLIILGVPYLAGLLLSVYSLHIVRARDVLTRSQGHILLITAIICLFATTSIYLISLGTGVMAYSPIWILYVILLVETWKLKKQARRL